MKRLSVLILVLFVLTAFAVPALASKLKIGGEVTTDVMFIKNDEHFQRNAADVTAALNSQDASRSWFCIDVPGSKLYAKWINDTGDVGMHIEIGIEGEEGQNEAVTTRYAYGWWKINDMFKLTVGQQKSLVSPYKAKGQNLGSDGKLGAGVGRDNSMSHSGLEGFGNTGADRKEAVRLDAKLGEKTTLSIEAITPNVEAGFGPWNRADEENTLPRMDIAFSTSLGAFSMIPSFSWQKFSYEWDPAAGGGQNDFSDFDAWLWSLPVMFAPAGPITVTAELNWGENIGNGSWKFGRYGYAAPNGNVDPDAQVDLINGVWQVADTEFLGFWIDLCWKVHPIAKAHFFYGMQQLTNDDRNLAANRWDNTRVAYGISVPIKVAKTFIISPEVAMYDYGENEINGLVDPLNGDLGHQTLVGVNFKIKF